MRALLAALAIAAALPLSAQAQDVLPGEMTIDIAGIDGVIANDAQWERIWSGPMTADGMAVTPDGYLLFAQEQSDSIRKLWPDGREWVEVPYVSGAGAVTVDAQGRMLAVERSCTDPGRGQPNCAVPSRIVQLAPDRRVIAESFADGSTLGRLNDLHGDGRGGAWFTQGALYHVDAQGTVTTVAEVENFTNGVVTSPDGSTLYTTDMRDILAFDIDAEGKAGNRRVFATLARDTAGFGGDGMAVDADGRLYVTGDAGVYVFAPDGDELGVIPTPRRAITLAFAGHERDTLYIGAMGAVTPAGTPWETPEGVRNVAMTIYRTQVMTSGPR